MKQLRLGSNSAVFVIFFGLAMLEAITSGDFLWIIFWMLVGIIFLLSDNIE